LGSPKKGQKPISANWLEKPKSSVHEKSPQTTNLKKPDEIVFQTIGLI